jgi:UDP-N-acetylmuramate dehydrogenase
VISTDQFAEIQAGVDGEVPHYPAAAGTVKLPAAWLIEKAGFAKGFALGRAGIASRHTLALVNLGGATADDLIALRDLVVRGVKDRFGIELQMEPVLLGF